MNLAAFSSTLPSVENLMNLLSIGHHMNVATAEPAHLNVSMVRIAGSTINFPAES